MSSHFSALGFHVKDAQGFGMLVERALRFGDEESSTVGSYIVWRLNGGIEIWVYENNDEVMGCNPHLVSRHVYPAQVTVSSGEDTGEGHLHVSTSVFGDPLGIDVDTPNGHQALLTTTAESAVSLVGFVHRVAVTEKSLGVVPMPERSFATVRGRVSEIQRMTNSDTETSFTLLDAEFANGSRLTLVGEEMSVELGQTIEAVVWLSARLLEVEQTA